MKIYCFDCSCYICIDYSIKNHLSHFYEFVSEAVPEMKKKHLEPFEEVKVSLSHTVKEIQSAQAKIVAKGGSVDTIKRSFDHLHKVIEHREQELLKETAKSGRKVELSI